MTGSPSSKGYYDGNHYIPYADLTVDQLRTLKLQTQKHELKYWRKMGKCADTIAAIEQEAEKRGVRLRDFESKYHRANKRARKRLGELKSQGII